MSMMLQKTGLGLRTTLPARGGATRRALVIRNNSEKTNINEVGLNSIENDVVKNNLMGKSRYMDKKGWVDAQGRKGKGYGVYRFADKYGANVDGYSPIYTPDRWTEGGGSYKLGAKGLIAWAGLVVMLLAIGANLIISTSQLGA
ncbi:photosystem II 10 kDa protein chloroplastic [Raphidocelis subcapitata]|uniref:Photosystem II 10 kDa protein chloroplastic n=1 Tax=Raphidocelis subcapitata TaxID=307507 RepID=A0A2V0PG32_9CHLO|nr:photosystem II 10 kDa protein chloroplastic [Raphidocelis subcapitata]|eukprot:GBF98499.1 photosystem II 10 kDa protein chloroplastic [Raphidocelis subcapitata]